MMKNFDTYLSSMAVWWGNHPLVKTASVAVLIAASMTGCTSLFNGVEFSDPNKALLFAYVRFDDKTGAGWIHFRDATTNGDDDNDQVLQQIGEWKEDGSCILFAGTVSMGTYEIEALSGPHLAYKFAKNAPGNLKITISKPDAYFIGQFQMGQVDEPGFLNKGTFSFKKTTGCPNEKTAFQTFLNEELFKPYLEGTRWPKILAKKIGK
jgi:hypothetical protein